MSLYFSCNSKNNHIGYRRGGGGGRYSFALTNGGANYVEGPGGNRKARRNRALKILFVAVLLISLYFGLNKFVNRIPEPDAEDGLSELADQSIRFAKRLPRGRRMLLFLLLGALAALFGRNKIFTKVVESSQSPEEEDLVEAIYDPATDPNLVPVCTDPNGRIRYRSLHWDRYDLLVALGAATIIAVVTTAAACLVHCFPVVDNRLPPPRITLQTPTNPGVALTVPVPAGMSPAATAALQIAEQYVEFPVHTSSPLEPDGFTFVYGALRIPRAAFQLVVEALTHSLY